jgi:DNA-binding response OmpR family regulator
MDAGALRKPYRRRELAERVRATLSSRRSGSGLKAAVLPSASGRALF